MEYALALPDDTSSGIKTYDERLVSIKTAEFASREYEAFVTCQYTRFCVVYFHHIQSISSIIQVLTDETGLDKHTACELVNAFIMDTR